MPGTLVAFAATTDLDASHAFYDGVLRLTTTDRSPFANVYDVDGTELRVTKVNEYAPPPYTVLGFKVEDIAATVERLRAKGVSFLRYPTMHQDEHDTWTSPSGARIAWFEDPDGNVLSLQAMS